MNALIAACLLAMTASRTPTEPNDAYIRTMPVARTPESNTIVLAIAVPKNEESVSTPVWIQFRLDGFALGAGSQFERAKEVAKTKMGQTVHVVVDDHPYFPINEPAIDPFNENGFYYDMSFKFEIPFRLKDGAHVVRMFPARSFGESLKGEKTFQTLTFYVGGSDRQNLNVDLSRPFLTYNEPSNHMYLLEGSPVLLDFLVSNTELSPDGYKVQLTIDGKTNRKITSWQPYYIFGLKKGRHTVQLELLDENDQLVPGAFNKVQETITVH